MPEVVRGVKSTDGLSPDGRTPTRGGRPSLDQTLSNESQGRSPSPRSPAVGRHVAFTNAIEETNEPSPAPPLSRDRRHSSSFFRRESTSRHRDRPDADVYYDSRAATKREFRRRPTTLEDYYKSNPALLPQLPFTWHHGKKRWRLWILIIVMWIDACVLPIALYYGMYYGGKVENWITFAVVTTIWGGPTYLEFAIRTFKLMRKERFYRPLGTNYRWCFDLVHWASVVTVTTVTALFVVGSAPHIVWLRVLCMPAPAILYCLGGIVGILTLYHKMGWKAPFRISSTGKGELVRPGVYYFIEDVVAVNANAGRPYREGLSARYEASPRFRAMLYKLSIAWSIPALIVAIPLTVIAVIHPVPATVAYAICWAVPFIWATVWALYSVIWVKKEMAKERTEWEMDKVPEHKHELEEEASHSPAPEERARSLEAKDREPEPAPESEGEKTKPTPEEQV